MGSYDKTLGTLLIGIFVNTYLYGLVTYQFAAYHRTKFNDRPVTKYTVLFLFILDTFHSIGVIYVAWYYAVANYDNPTALSVNVWPYPFTAIGNALSATVTQLYLGYRIWCLTNSKVLYCMVVTLAIPSCFLGLACGAASWIVGSMSKLDRIMPLVIAWWSVSVTLDVFITITLVTIFIRSRTGFCKTDTILNRLIRGAIQSGLFSSVPALGDLITFIILRHTNFFGMFAIPRGRIYTNTFLDTLLTRELLKPEMDGTDHTRGELGSLSWRPADPLQTTSAARMTCTQITVEETVPEFSSSHERGEDKIVLDRMNTKAD